jgi:replicative DNA helicase
MSESERDQSRPPHNLHAEQSVLGSVLKNPNVMAKLADLEAQSFYSRRNQAVWHAMVDLWERSVPIDYTTVDGALRRLGLSEQSGGLMYLAELNVAIPTAAHVEHYAKLVTDTATQRRFIGAAQSIVETWWRDDVVIDEAIERTEAFIAAARPRASRHDLQDPERWAEVFADDLEARSSGQRTAVNTGLLALDTMTLGLEAGGLYLLMATPGTGKSELAMQVAMHVAQSRGPVLFASLEMTAVELAHRFARISKGLNRNRLAAGLVEAGEEPLIDQVVNAMTKVPFWPASPRGAYTTSNLRADAIEVQSRAGHLALIVADYVQRFRDRGSKISTREENVGIVAENLKSLAREFGCPVLAPVQPNRDYVTRGNKRPLLSDLRESGKLEQEADVVLGLYRDEKHDDGTRDRGLAEIHMLKNRSGVGDADGMRKIVWRGSRYADYTKDERANDDPYWVA